MSSLGQARWRIPRPCLCLDNNRLFETTPRAKLAPWGSVAIGHDPDELAVSVDQDRADIVLPHQPGRVIERLGIAPAARSMIGVPDQEARVHGTFPDDRLHRRHDDLLLRPRGDTPFEGHYPARDSDVDTTGFARREGPKGSLERRANCGRRHPGGRRPPRTHSAGHRHDATFAGACAWCVASSTSTPTRRWGSALRGRCHTGAPCLLIVGPGQVDGARRTARAAHRRS